MVNYNPFILHGANCLHQFSYILNNDIDLDLPKDKPVLIKVNMLRPDDGKKSITTDVKVAEVLVKHFKDKGYEVIVGDGGESCFDTLQTFAMNGYVDMCNNYNVKLVDLNKSPIELKIIGGIQMFISKIALESSVISVAKIKPHSMFQVTGTLKNLMGCVLPKGHMHDNFTNKIIDVYNYIKPVYGVIDGIVANGKCENISCPIKLDTIICSKSLVTLDKIESYILNRKADHIETLANIEKVSIDTEKVEKIKSLYDNGGVY